jgi:chaperonin cofactor prefoldin
MSTTAHPERTTAPAEGEAKGYHDLTFSLQFDRGAYQALQAQRTTEDGTPAADDPLSPLPVSLSSEHPVMRYDWWEGREYLEVLVHTPAAVDMARASRGMPLLLCHDRYEQHGRLINLRVEDKRLVGDMVFSRHAESQRYRQDVIDGIREEVSVRYEILEYRVAEGENGAMPTYYIERWRPMEGSLEPLPADWTVGSNRNAASADGAVRNALPQPQGRRAQEPTVSQVVTGDPPVNDAQRALERRDQIEQMLESAGMDLREARELSRSDKPIHEIGAMLMRKQEEQLREKMKPVVLTAKETKRYSFARLIQSLVSERKSFETEVSEEIEKKMGAPKNGRAYYPTLMEGEFSVQEDQRTLLSVAGSGKGAELKFTEYGGFAEALRARMFFDKLNVTFLNGLQGDFGLTRQTAPGTFSWGATETTNAALSSLSLGQTIGAPKNGQSATSFTRQILRQSPFAVEPLVRRDLLGIHARGIESAGVAGPGTGGAPRGILNTVGVNAVVVGVNGGLPTYDHIVDMETQVATDNADFGSLGYFGTPGLRGRLKRTQVFTGTNGEPVWKGGIEGELNGYRAYASTTMPSNLTKGTSNGICHAMIYGDWSALMVLEWGAAEILVDELTLGPSQIKVMSFQLIDTIVRFPDCFAIVNDFTV